MGQGELNMWFAVAALVVSVWGVYSWRAWRVPRSEAVPSQWRAMGYRHPDAADALRIRKSLNKMILEKKSVALKGLLVEVDLTVSAIVLICQARPPGEQPEDVCRAAVALLVELDHLRVSGDLASVNSLMRRLKGQRRDLDLCLKVRAIEQPRSLPSKL